MSILPNKFLLMSASSLLIAGAALAAGAADAAGAAGATTTTPSAANNDNDHDNDSDGRQDSKEDGKNPLRSLLRKASRARNYQTPSPAELKQAAQLFAQLFAANGKDAIKPTLQAQARAIDMEIRQLGDLTILSEAENAQRGRGFFVFRNNTLPNILQVPHAFKDEMTRDIGLALFAEGPFAAVAFNTVPRRFAGAQQEEIVADMAHISDTYFLEFTRAGAKAHAKGRTLQIHGFDQNKRKSASLAASDIILSAGHKQPPASLQQGRQKLQKSLPGGVTLYADEIRELGATTNVQAAALRSMGYDHFIHIEMSRPMRNTMRIDAASRAQLLHSLLDEQTP